jgi:hypothetical protein
VGKHQVDWLRAEDLKFPSASKFLTQETSRNAAYPCGYLCGGNQ